MCYDNICSHCIATGIYYFTLRLRPAEFLLLVFLDVYMYVLPIKRVRLWSTGSFILIKTTFLTLALRIIYKNNAYCYPQCSVYNHKRFRPQFWFGALKNSFKPWTSFVLPQPLKWRLTAHSKLSTYPEKTPISEWKLSPLLYQKLIWITLPQLTKALMSSLTRLRIMAGGGGLCC